MSVVYQGSDNSQPDQERTLSLEVNCYEVAFLMDNVKIDDVDQGNPDNPNSDEPLAERCWLALSGAYRDLITIKGFNDKETRTVWITHKMARLFKGKLTTPLTYLSKDALVGVTLTLKLLKILEAFDAGVDRMQGGTDRSKFDQKAPPREMLDYFNSEYDKEQKDASA